jgi:hypothetical protein
MDYREFSSTSKHQWIYKENLDNLRPQTFIVCAMFTPDHIRYFRCADRLADSCERYGLPHSIYKVAGMHTSISAAGTGDLAFTKANFIRFNQERFRDNNILYVDADMVFTDYPEAIFRLNGGQFDFAIYNWLSDAHDEAYVPIVRELGGKILFSEFYRYSHRVNYYSNTQLICSGGVQFYRNSVPARHLLEAWQGVVAENPYSADDECLDYAHNNFSARSGSLRSFWLEKSYLRMPWWPHVKPVILHPCIPAAGNNRRPVAGRNNLRRFYPERCQLKAGEIYFPSDYIIDTRRHLLLKYEDEKLVDVKRIEKEFWIYPETE